MQLQTPLLWERGKTKDPGEEKPFVKLNLTERAFIFYPFRPARISHFISLFGIWATWPILGSLGYAVTPCAG